jgi:hypothetical protein
VTRVVVAEFETAETTVDAAQTAARQDHRPVDALTPFPVPELWEHLCLREKRPVGWVIVVAGATAAAAAYFLQWYSAVIDYPIISGNRPLNSWPVFLLVVFEACILFAGFAGFVAFARDCRFPSLHHPLFEIPAVERASQDRFFLVFETSESAREELLRLLHGLKPASVNEVPS